MSRRPAILAVIPARGGSRRLPGKNVLRLGDRPVIAWTIRAAEGSRLLDDTVVSTDNSRIARAARKWGGVVPFLRPARLATSRASSVDVAIDALGRMEEKTGRRYDYLVLLQPTSPLRTTEDIDNAIRLCVRRKARAVITVSPAEHDPRWTNSLGSANSMKGFLDPRKRRNRGPFYRLNGAVYVCRADVLRRERTFFPSKGCYASVMPVERSVDIDTRTDFILAEALARKRCRGPA
jgi:CMP-N-acetylneuraminic acid synthetase